VALDGRVQLGLFGLHQSVDAGEDGTQSGAHDLGGAEQMPGGLDQLRQGLRAGGGRRRERANDLTVVHHWIGYYQRVRLW
jgi:hypothetical protein